MPKKEINTDDNYKFIEHLGTVSEKLVGKFIFRQELNKMSYNGGRPVYDLRTWKIEKLNRTNVTRCEGIKLTKAQVERLCFLIETEVLYKKR